MIDSEEGRDLGCLTVSSIGKGHRVIDGEKGSDLELLTVGRGGA